jgi:hypothetical protein
MKMDKKIRIKGKGLLAVFLMLAMLLFFLVGMPTTFAKNCPGTDCDKKWQKVITSSTTEERTIFVRIGREKVPHDGWKTYRLDKTQARTCSTGDYEKDCWTVNQCSVTHKCEKGDTISSQTCCDFTHQCTRWQTTGYVKTYL